MSFLSFRYEDHSNLFSEECFKARVKENIDYLEKVQEGEEKYASFLGWHRVDEWAGEEWLKRYESLAGEIRKECDTLVVIGVGGSNQAARAVYEALGKKDIEIIWAGNTLSAHSVNKLFEKLERILFISSMGLFITYIIIIIFHIDNIIISWIASIIYSLYIGYDIYKSQQINKTADNAVDCAINVYVDIIVLFLNILDILGKTKDKND